jgi:hypothetical protein
MVKQARKMVAENQFEKSCKVVETKDGWVLWLKRRKKQAAWRTDPEKWCSGCMGIEHTQHSLLNIFLAWMTNNYALILTSLSKVENLDDDGNVLL